MPQASMRSMSLSNSELGHKQGVFLGDIHNSLHVCEDKRHGAVESHWSRLNSLYDTQRQFPDLHKDDGAFDQ